VTTSRAAALALLFIVAGCGRRAGVSPLPGEPLPDEGARLEEPPRREPEVEGACAADACDVADIVERVKPSVVNITTARESRDRAEPFDPFDFFFGPPDRRRPRKVVGQGSGFIIDAAGYVLTNEHVVRDAAEVNVRLADDREFTAKVVGRDPKLDLALLELQGAKDLPTGTLGSSERLRVGKPVVAIGNPFGLGHTVTSGIVSAKDRTIGAGPYDDFIQTDASINPGNSGGPLLDGHGEVVGMNTAIRAGASGIGFAIPVDAIKEVLPQLREKGHVERGKMGLVVQPVTHDLAKALGLPSTQGALVADVEPKGPAARAGVRQGDVIIAVDRKPVRSSDELPRAVAKHPPGSRIALTLLRDRERREVVVTLEKLEDEPSNPVPAKQTQTESERAARSFGLRVTNVPGGGVRVDEASRGDLEPGDVILEACGRPVATADALRAALAGQAPGDVALLRVRREDQTFFATLPIPKR
jgi:serine protease Do